MSSNGINERQNAEISIKMLAAQRQIYSEAKIYSKWVVFFSVIGPFLCAVLQAIFSSNDVINATTYILSIIGMFVSLFTNSTIEKKQNNAAYIQQLFDVKVYKIDWDKKLFGTQKSMNNLIADKSKGICSNNQRKKQLKNWYPESYDSLPIKKAITECQKANIYWDTNIRVLYRNVCCVVVLIMLVIIMAIGLIKNESVFMLICRLAFVIPLFYWLLDSAKSINKDVRRIEELKNLLDDISDKNMDEILEIQSGIFAHRKECTLIPDWFYKVTQKNEENKMRDVAQIDTEND